MSMKYIDPCSSSQCCCGGAGSGLCLPIDVGISGELDEITKTFQNSGWSVSSQSQYGSLVCVMDGDYTETPSGSNTYWPTNMLNAVPDLTGKYIAFPCVKINGSTVSQNPIITSNGNNVLYWDCIGADPETIIDTVYVGGYFEGAPTPSTPIESAANCHTCTSCGSGGCTEGFERVMRWKIDAQSPVIGSGVDEATCKCRAWFRLTSEYQSPNPTYGWCEWHYGKIGLSSFFMSFRVSDPGHVELTVNDVDYQKYIHPGSYRPYTPTTYDPEYYYRIKIMAVGCGTEDIAIIDHDSDFPVTVRTDLCPMDEISFVSLEVLPAES